MLHIEPRHDHAAAIVGARSLVQALMHANHLLAQYRGGCWRHTLIVAIYAPPPNQ